MARADPYCACQTPVLVVAPVALVGVWGGCRVPLPPGAVTHQCPQRCIIYLIPRSSTTPNYPAAHGCCCRAQTAAADGLGLAACTRGSAPARRCRAAADTWCRWGVRGPQCMLQRGVVVAFWGFGGAQMPISDAFMTLGNQPTPARPPLRCPIVVCI